MIVTLLCVYQEQPRWPQTHAITFGPTATKNGCAGSKKTRYPFAIWIICMCLPRRSVKNSLLTLYLVVMTTAILITARRPVAHAEENPCSTRSQRWKNIGIERRQIQFEYLLLNSMAILLECNRACIAKILLIISKIMLLRAVSNADEVM